MLYRPGTSNRPAESATRACLVSPAVQPMCTWALESVAINPALSPPHVPAAIGPGATESVALHATSAAIPTTDPMRLISASADLYDSCIIIAGRWPPVERGRLGCGSAGLGPTLSHCSLLGC